MNRDDFPMINGKMVYFDNSATAFKPQVVIDKINEYYTKYSANAHRGDYDVSYKVDYEYEQARDVLQKFINAENRNEIIFTSGATEGINMIVNGFFDSILEPGDEIILTKGEHASNVLPWFRLARNNDLVIKYIELDEYNYVTTENLLKEITSKTKVIALAHITNVIGDLRPIQEISSIAHNNNIFFVVDAAQSAPHMKIDVQQLDVDFLVLSGHKMCGPTGIGILYAKEKLLEHLEPTNYGGGMNESFTSPIEVQLKQLPTRLEAGTPNIAGAIGLGAAAEYLMSIGLDKIHEYELELRKYLIEKLLKYPHIDIINLKSDSGIVSFNIDDIFAQDVAFYLNKYNICVRAGNHCAKILKGVVGVNNTCRISLYFYNTKEEIDELLDLLKDKDRIVAEMF